MGNPYFQGMAWTLQRLSLLREGHLDHFQQRWLERGASSIRASSSPAKQGFPAIPLYRRNSMTTPVVLITGALTGIGRATALALAQESARIVVSGRRDQEVHGLTQELRARGVAA